MRIFETGGACWLGCCLKTRRGFGSHLEPCWLNRSAMSSNVSVASAVGEPQSLVSEWLASFDGQRVVNIESYKKNGDPKRTPVIFVQKNGKLYFHTAVKSYKAKRMTRNPHVRVTPSTFRGDPKGAWVDATVAPAEGREATGARWALVRRFTVMFLITSLVERILWGKIRYFSISFAADETPGRVSGL